MTEMDESHPIYQAIDRGGGQTCDIYGVIKALTKAGYVIVPKEPTDAMVAAVDSDWGTALEDNWRKLLEAACR